MFWDSKYRCCLQESQEITSRLLCGYYDQAGQRTGKLAFQSNGRALDRAPSAGRLAGFTRQNTAERNQFSEASKVHWPIRANPAKSGARGRGSSAGHSLRSTTSIRGGSWSLSKGRCLVFCATCCCLAEASPLAQVHMQIPGAQQPPALAFPRDLFL